MEGYLLFTTPNRRGKEWNKLYFKLDVVSGRLLSFKDMTQAAHKGTIVMKAAEIYTPILGDSNYGIDVSSKAYCFAICEAGASKEGTTFFSADDDAIKKKWMAALFKAARDGPKDAALNKVHSDQDFHFEARVTECRPHKDGYAEYMIVCQSRLLSRTSAKRLSKRWILWKRFSEFAALERSMRKAMSAEMREVNFPQRAKEAFKAIFVNKLDSEFMEQRRVILDNFMVQICQIRVAIDFLKHHCSLELKAFVDFDNQCKAKNDSSMKDTTRSTLSGAMSRQRSSSDQHRRLSKNDDNRDRSASHTAALGTVESKDNRREGTERSIPGKEESIRKTRDRKKDRKKGRTPESGDSGRNSHITETDKRRSSKKGSKVDNREGKDSNRQSKSRHKREARPSLPADVIPPPPPLPPSMPSQDKEAKSLCRPPTIPKASGSIGDVSLPPSRHESTIPPKLVTPGGPPGRSNLLAQIQAGKKLKKATAVSDRSSPVVGTTTAGHASANPSQNANESGGSMMDALQSAMKGRSTAACNNDSDTDDDWK